MEILKSLGIEPDVIIANIVSFLLLFALLKKFMVGPLSQVMKERKDEISSSFTKIEEDNAKLSASQAELQKRLDEIESESRVKIQEAAAQGAKLKDEILAEARAQAEQVKERSLQDIEREKDKALQSIRENVADLVAQVGEKILAQSMTDEKHRELINRTLNQLENIKN